MGLDCSHDAYSGGYISFMLFRIAVIEAMGGKFDDNPAFQTNSQPACMNFSRTLIAMAK